MAVSTKNSFYGPNIVLDDLLLYLDAGNIKSYPGSGSTWTDLTRKGNDASLINGPTYDNSNGGSIVFDGADDWANINGGADILSKTAYTKIVWFYITSFGTNNNLVTGSSVAQHALWLAGTNNLRAGHNGYWSTVVSTTTLLLNTWYCGAVTFSDTTGWVLYVNGIQESTSADTTTFGGSGLIHLATYDGGDNLLTGRIANVAVYNRVLTAEEIQQNFNALKGRFGI